MSVATAASTRIAGKALGDFLNVATLAAQAGALAQGIKGPTYDAKGNVVDQGSRRYQLIEPGVNLAGSAAIRAGESLLANKMKPVDYARQPYQAGTIPLTNEQAGYLYLEQEKQKNALALLQARENARVPNNQPISSIGMDTSATVAIGPMGAARAMYTTHQF